MVLKLSVSKRFAQSHKFIWLFSAEYVLFCPTTELYSLFFSNISSPCKKCERKDEKRIALINKIKVKFDLLRSATICIRWRNPKKDLFPKFWFCHPFERLTRHHPHTLFWCCNWSIHQGIINVFEGYKTLKKVILIVEKVASGFPFFLALHRRGFFRKEPKLIKHPVWFCFPRTGIFSSCLFVFVLWNSAVHSLKYVSFFGKLSCAFQLNVDVRFRQKFWLSPKFTKFTLCLFKLLTCHLVCSRSSAAETHLQPQTTLLGDNCDEHGRRPHCHPTRCPTGGWACIQVPVYPHHVTLPCTTAKVTSVTYKRQTTFRRVASPDSNYFELKTARDYSESNCLKSNYTGLKLIISLQI